MRVLRSPAGIHPEDERSGPQGLPRLRQVHAQETDVRRRVPAQGQRLVCHGFQGWREEEGKTRSPGYTAEKEGRWRLRKRRLRPPPLRRERSPGLFVLASN